MSTSDPKPAAAPIPGPAAAPAADPSPAPAPAPASDAPLDGDPYGFTAEERTAYDAQKSDTTKKAPVADPGAAPAAPGAPAAAVTAAGAPAAPGAPGADDDDTDDTDLEPDPSKPPPRRIAYHKFKRMADRAKAAEKDLSDFRVKSAGDMAKVEERISLINQALQTPAEKQQQQVEDPDRKSVV